MRIDKLISDSGLGSRREAADAARRGQLRVNGCVVRSAAVHVDPDRDEVVFCGTPIRYRRFTYVMLNKPTGYVSATDDARLPYVVELLDEPLRRIGLFPVGRLDRDTVGLMILTNNGALAHTLLSPRHHVEKVYRFSCRDPLAPDSEARVALGIPIDGYVCKSAVLSPDPDRLGGCITLTEGKYHQIKRMLEALDNKITFLERVSFASIPLDTSLARGEWRYLSDAEIAVLEAYGRSHRFRV